MSQVRAKSLLFLSTSTAQPEGAVGGGELAAIETLGELQRRGWKVTIAAPASSPIVRSFAKTAEIVRIDLAVKPSQPAAFLSVLAHWQKLVRQSEAALIYGNAFETLKWVSAAGLVSAKPTFCHLHESYYEPYGAFHTRLLAHKVQRFIAISETTRGEFVRRTGIPEFRVQVVLNGVEASQETESRAGLREQLEWPVSRPMILMAARTDPLKGHEVLLRAIPAVLARHPTSGFLIVGVDEESELATGWRALIDELAIGQAVTLAPFNPQVRRLMRAANLVIVPSTAEGFGRTAAEGMAEGTAVIASDAGGLAEIINSGEDGLLFPNRNSALLAAAINRLLDDPDERGRLAKNGQETIERRFSVAAMVTRLEHEFLKAIG